jgi:hypothetical protein
MIPVIAKRARREREETSRRNTNKNEYYIVTKYLYVYTTISGRE